MMILKFFHRQKGEWVGVIWDWLFFWIILVWFVLFPTVGEGMVYISPELLDSFLLSNIFDFLTPVSFCPL